MDAYTRAWAKAPSPLDHLCLCSFADYTVLDLDCIYDAEVERGSSESLSHRVLDAEEGEASVLQRHITKFLREHIDGTCSDDEDVECEKGVVDGSSFEIEEALMLHDGRRAATKLHQVALEGRQAAFLNSSSAEPAGPFAMVSCEISVPPPNPRPHPCRNRVVPSSRAPLSTADALDKLEGPDSIDDLLAVLLDEEDLRPWVVGKSKALGRKRQEEEKYNGRDIATRAEERRENSRPLAEGRWAGDGALRIEHGGISGAATMSADSSTEEMINRVSQRRQLGRKARGVDAASRCALMAQGFR